MSKKRRPVGILGRAVAEDELLDHLAGRAPPGATRI
jgi:hypothetical protein